MRKPLFKYYFLPNFLFFVTVYPPHPNKKGGFIASSDFSYSNFVENAPLNEAINFRKRG
jgi:hypothetical protein